MKSVILFAEIYEILVPEVHKGSRTAIYVNQTHEESFKNSCSHGFSKISHKCVMTNILLFIDLWCNYAMLKPSSSLNYKLCTCRFRQKVGYPFTVFNCAIFQTLTVGSVLSGRGKGRPCSVGFQLSNFLWCTCWTWFCLISECKKKSRLEDLGSILYKSQWKSQSSKYFPKNIIRCFTRKKLGSICSKKQQ